ncbi:MAG TPA: hypothetical protein VJY41_03520 [Prolixibacteraceae bacterium]|nr:hypothetical protein [Prolixibacteraceae bacterium]
MSVFSHLPLDYATPPTPRLQRGVLLLSFVTTLRYLLMQSFNNYRITSTSIMQPKDA